MALNARASRRRPHAQRVVRGDGDGNHRLGAVDTARGTPQGGVERRFGKEHQLGALGAEHPAGMFEEGADRGIELGRVVEQPARLVQELEALVLLALTDVGAIGDEHHGRWHRQQDDRSWVEPDDHDGECGETRIGHRDHLAEAQHLGQQAQLRAPPDSEIAVATRVASRALVMPAATNAASHSRGPGGLAGSGDGMEDHQADDGSKAELGQVECPAHARLLPVKEQRQPGAENAGRDVFGRWQQEQEGDAGHLAQREGVPLAQEVDVDDVGLAEEEGHGRQRPRDEESRRQRWRRDIAHHGHVEDRGDRGDDHREAADADGGRQPRRCDEASAVSAGSLDRGRGAVLSCGCCHRDLATVDGGQRQCPACGARTP